MNSLEKKAFSSLKFSILAWLLFANLSHAFAQKEINLYEVTVKGVRPERFMVGQKVNNVDSTTLAQNSFRTMADFLQFQAPVAFKSYGAGQVSTVSFRGTSSSHTAVLWNGFNINFPSLGLTDFSTIPVSGFDAMSVQYGSAASVVGSEAVGGSIQLRSTPDFNSSKLKGFIGVRAENSENYNFQSGLRYNLDLKKGCRFAGKSLFYGNWNKNNFGTEPIQSRNGNRYNVEPQTQDQKGITQDLYLQKTNGNLWSLNLWFTDNNLIIQPRRIELREITRTQAYRTQASYLWGKTMFRTGFIRDITDFGRAENLKPAHTKIDRYIMRIEHDFSWIKNSNKGSNLKVGGEMSRFMADVDGYGGFTKAETRTDLYALYRHQFNASLVTSLNLRQAFVTAFNPPFTPSFGLEYTGLNKLKNKIIFSGSVARSYRVPTLNERYWLDLGDPDLKPESGLNKEVGVSWENNMNENSGLNISLTVFHNLIDNWTYWNPEKNYRVENLQKVLSKGAEVEFKWRKKYNKLLMNYSLIYSQTHSSQQKEFGAYTKDIIGKQLIYVPVHVIAGSSSANFKAFSTSVQYSLNSKRYVTFDHSGRPFPAYLLLNASFNYKYPLKKSAFDFAFQVNNISNTVYPNLKKNAMPIRSFSLNIFYNF